MTGQTQFNIQATANLTQMSAIVKDLNHRINKLEDSMYKLLADISVRIDDLERRNK